VTYPQLLKTQTRKYGDAESCAGDALDPRYGKFLIKLSHSLTHSLSLTLTHSLLAQLLTGTYYCPRSVVREFSTSCQRQALCISCAAGSGPGRPRLGRRLRIRHSNGRVKLSRSMLRGIMRGRIFRPLLTQTID
jgi:hypothetical protein